jgi:hypothetical protein
MFILQDLLAWIRSYQETGETTFYAQAGNVVQIYSLNRHFVVVTAT